MVRTWTGRIQESILTQERKGGVALLNHDQTDLYQLLKGEK
jgi:hypothetical protein